MRSVAWVMFLGLTGFYSFCVTYLGVWGWECWLLCLLLLNIMLFVFLFNPLFKFRVIRFIGFNYFIFEIF